MEGYCSTGQGPQRAVVPVEEEEEEEEEEDDDDDDDVSFEVRIKFLRLTAPCNLEDRYQP
jgi:hypothetical protein